MGLILTFIPILLTQCFLSALVLSQTNYTTDESALLEFKDHIFSDPLNILSSNWSSAASICSWIGVSCGLINRRVTSLNLPNMNLSGTLPPHLGNLSFLASLNLSGNSLSGYIPSELGKLQRLQRIDLSSNFLQGSLSGSFQQSSFNLTSLEWISLKNNALTGTLPDDFCYNLPNLKMLYLYMNQLNGSIPINIDECRKLRVLDLSSNGFTGYIPRSIGNMTELTEIYLSNNDLEGEIPTELGNLLNLETLSIAEMGLTGLIPPTIFNMSSLKHIYFPNNSLSGTLPNDLCRHLPMLEELNFISNKLTGTIPVDIGNCTLLNTLQIGENFLTGTIPEEVGNLPLSILHLESNFLSGSIPSAIFNISTLEHISLRLNNLSGQLPSEILLPKLAELYLSRNKLSGTLPSSISNSSLLTNLTISFNSFSGPLPNSLGDLRFIRWLDLSQNFMKSDGNFLSSLTKCRFLTRLTISSNTLNAVLPASIGNLSDSLQVFHARNCTIKGRIPAEIGNLSNLIDISLAKNHLTGSIPTTIRRMQQLQGLILYKNKLQGAIPYDICHLKALSFLRLDDNQFNGSIPGCLDLLTSLRSLNLSSNFLSSSIPSTFWNHKFILEVNLSSNSISGFLPPEIENLNVMISLDLSRNQLRGTLPSSIGGCQELNVLSLAENTLEGNIPESFGGLVSLEFLNLSNNNLSGGIPKSLEALSSLEFLNLSFNRLQGEIPSGGPFGNFSAQSFIGNAALCGSPRLHVPLCRRNSSQSKKKQVHLLISILPSIAAIMIILTLIITFRRCCKSKAKPEDELPVSSPSPTNWKRISHWELQQATDRFHKGNLLGVGSFGSVYSGILPDGMRIAVKVFNLQVDGASRSFETECEVLSSVRHRNLIKIISSCCNEDFKALVLEFMPNGTLEMWLHSDKHCLDIIQRMDIMIDVASALEYLHHGYSVPIVHSDLKPSNVLLDEDMVAHVGDFGLSKLLGGGESVTETIRLATIGYIAPEYGSSAVVSAKGDVYSYGILLMEAFTRKKPTDEMFTTEMSLKVWVRESLTYSAAEIADASLLSNDEEHSVEKMNCVSSVMELALDCSSEASKERPNMMDVVALLKKIKGKYLQKIKRSSYS